LGGVEFGKEAWKFLGYAAGRAAANPYEYWLGGQMENRELRYSGRRSQAGMRWILKTSPHLVNGNIGSVFNQSRRMKL
jgi:hypothetical protein